MQSDWHYLKVKIVNEMKWKLSKRALGNKNDGLFFNLRVVFNLQNGLMN